MNKFFLVLFIFIFSLIYSENSQSEEYQLKQCYELSRKDYSFNSDRFDYFNFKITDKEIINDKSFSNSFYERSKKHQPNLQRTYHVVYSITHRDNKIIEGFAELGDVSAKIKIDLNTEYIFIDSRNSTSGKEYSNEIHCTKNNQNEKTIAKIL